MKQSHISHRFLMTLFILLVVAGFHARLYAQTISPRTSNWDVFERTSDNFHEKYEQFSKELEGVIKDPNSSNLNQCTAAHYLGKMRVADAVDLLADDITLLFDRTRLPLMKHLVNIDIISEHPAMEALIMIGNPSIPAMIRHLEESDDIQVRDLSLKVLYRIEGDKDIVQLRLQKALAVQKDSHKQARLQLALKAIGGASFGK